MNRATEKKFEEIAREAISSAERVRCPGPHFVEGLELIAEQLHERLSEARREFRGDT